jgi:hypothetical protein
MFQGGVWRARVKSRFADVAAGPLYSSSRSGYRARPAKSRSPRACSLEVAIVTM